VTTRPASSTSGGIGLGSIGGGLSRLTTETKQAFKTTEFWSFVVVLIGLLIAGNSIEAEEGATDYFAADKVWLYITILTVGYMVSRGLAKSGSGDPYTPDRGNDPTTGDVDHR
jgi:hypothetical protein